MKRLLLPLSLVLSTLFTSALLLTGGMGASAQSTGTPTQTTTSTSNVTILLVVCDTRAVLNFSGTMEAGRDIYYQVFNGAAGSGTALTSLRQVAVNGTYQISEVVNYDLAATVTAGNVGSASVVIASETDSTNILYQTTVNDIQDGCADPAFTIGTSTDAGDSAADATYAGPQILSPFGGFLNPNYNPTAPETVVIGARDLNPPRQETPGLIFAECDDYRRANPGLIYDTDNVVVFWSWYARTEDQVQDHIDNAIYEVSMFDGEPLIPAVLTSDIQRRGTNYFVFYTVNLGNVKPGRYSIAYGLRWAAPINDGYDDYGPGTANPKLESSCEFFVAGNPAGAAVKYTFP